MAEAVQQAHEIDPNSCRRHVQGKFKESVLESSKGGVNVKIGVMLRHLGQHGGGVLVYTQNLLREMLTLDTPHEFVLLYQEPSWLGSFSDGYGNRVRELALGKAPTIMWDQWLVPQVEKREKFDLIFNPKYSLPLLSKSRTVDEIALIDQLGISQWMLWPGWIDHKTLPAFYALAGAFPTRLVPRVWSHSCCIGRTPVAFVASRC
jgi:hypothetical protein